MKPVVVMTQTSNIQSDLVEIVHKPFIQIQSLECDTQFLDYNYDWLIFSSKNAVRLFYQYLDDVNVKSIAAIGSKTAHLCEELGINVDFIPSDYSQEGLLRELKVHQQTILIPSSAKARPKLQQELAKNNDVIKIDLYQPIAHHENIQEVIQLIKSNKVNALTFSSSSAVRYYFSENIPSDFYDYYAIGEQTAHTIKQYGYSPKIANKQTLESLINKIVESRNL
ncbi:uroporphyrinogen-III synthase [Staphylococcus devriesei]|uniref:Uroporphyrinogen-III synthase n=1 Tax=Staphylococcus devriesei TaxID=586733 RepID=A0A2T4L2L4_9STAP|nr:uroporphyrinogen-III synthase [Staphylococcus devriesei]PTE71830.1 uroporphyrinogen III synthase [Staphylococcus devriesei]PTF03870.1 uroporphyrinogen III synthase [Staphylococcus devriesei]PTF15995.1 uroporphyrinogen III synthase [Staphylococcus devriesei]RIL71946.1 uroporphyrinogen-III synthase [Staphylococcus devriesei]RIL73976.1 uroporphyrinogen-III synthase [Staphylococcus devriesei]